MASKIASTSLRTARTARALAPRAVHTAQHGRRGYAQVLPGFQSRDLIPDEPAGPSVKTESVPGPAGKAAVSYKLGPGSGEGCFEADKGSPCRLTACKIAGHTLLLGIMKSLPVSSRPRVLSTCRDLRGLYLRVNRWGTQSLWARWDCDRNIREAQKSGQELHFRAPTQTHT
jgi:hypothetical protein